MKKPEESKKKLHPRNKHNTLYDFDELKIYVPDLSFYIIKNPSGDATIDFSDPQAVRLLNKALLMSVYKLTYWELPKDNLCPPIPGRADYIHYIADLLAESNHNSIPTGSNVRILDIGVGASMIYPLIGVSEYGWQFVASDVNPFSLESASHIINNNPHLVSNISLRLQPNKKNILKNIISDTEEFHVVLCNPPFFKSKEEAYRQTFRKLKNLQGKKPEQTLHNFGGLSNELWCEGGELEFISNYIKESKEYKNQVNWFTSLIANKDHLHPLKRLLKKVGVAEIRVIDMQQGNKISRILAWKY